MHSATYLPCGAMVAVRKAFVPMRKLAERPDEWRPRRWDSLSCLQDEKGSVKVDYGYGPVSAGATSPYLPFGGGRHRCIGEQFTYLQLTSIVAIMVRMFGFRTVEGQEGLGVRIIR